MRKYGRLTGAPHPAVQPEVDDRSWVTTDIPWDLDQPPARPDPATPPAGAPLPRLARHLEPARVDRGLVDVESAWREQLTPIVQSMLRKGPPDTRLRSLLFTAIGPEPSSRFCAATADALARQTTGSVCLVDCNLHAPSLHASFGMNGAPGVSNVLLQGGDLRGFLAGLRPNLWLLPAGTRCADALPAVGGEPMRRHLTELLATFDYVLLDTSPASAHGDAAALGPLVGGVVLIVGANATRREVARRSVEQLRVANAKVLGAILTNRDFPIPEPLYRML
jgi:Mrp family chromosome partitioning ATPase